MTGATIMASARTELACAFPAGTANTARWWDAPTAVPDTEIAGKMATTYGNASAPTDGTVWTATPSWSGTATTTSTTTKVSAWFTQCYDSPGAI